jgi:hypothetical protein
MTEHPTPLPPLPEIGHPEVYYARRVQMADRAGDLHTYEAHKVGQYITLGLDRMLTWEQKLRYFVHALKRHCVPPPLPDEQVWMFYRGLAYLVREHCGAEALRLASEADESYDKRQHAGVSRAQIEDEAEEFFHKLLGFGEKCPFYFNEEDWAQLKLLRNQWI